MPPSALTAFTADWKASLIGHVCCPPLPDRSMIQPTLYELPDAGAPAALPLVADVPPVVPPVLAAVVADEVLCELDPHADTARAPTPTRAKNMRRPVMRPTEHVRFPSPSQSFLKRQPGCPRRSSTRCRRPSADYSGSNGNIRP